MGFKKTENDAVVACGAITNHKSSLFIEIIAEE